MKFYMALFNHAASLSKSNKSAYTGGLISLSVPFQKIDKNELAPKNVIQALDKYKNMPLRLLRESNNVIQKFNRSIIKPEQRKELTELLVSYIYPVVSRWHTKHQSEENSLPESNERRDYLVASIEGIHLLSVAYKLLFSDSYSGKSRDYKKNHALIYQHAARALELIRLEQRLRALRYQKLPQTSWQHCNQIFFSLAHHGHMVADYEPIAFSSIIREIDRPKNTRFFYRNAQKIYLSIQLFGLLDITTWPTHLFHIPDNYLEFLGEGIKLLADNGKRIKPGFLLTYYNNDRPPSFKRHDNFVTPLIRFDYSLLFNTLVKDHEEVGKQQFLNMSDKSRFSRSLADVADADRVPVLELMLMGLTHRERKQKRHASFDDSCLGVYFGFKEVYRLLSDLVATNQERVKAARQLTDSLARSTAAFADDKISEALKGWTITNFSEGGLLIQTEESDFNNPIQIDMLIAFTMPDNTKKPIIGVVRRLNRPSEKRIELAVVRLSNYAESAGVQAQDELGSAHAKAVILIKNTSGEWNLITKTSLSFSKGQPLKLIRANGTRVPIRLGSSIHTKTDFKVFDVSSPGLK